MTIGDGLLYLKPMKNYLESLRSSKIVPLIENLITGKDISIENAQHIEVCLMITMKMMKSFKILLLILLSIKVLLIMNLYNIFVNRI